MRFVLAMLFPMAMTGSTISATVNCGSGPIGGIGVSSVSCSVQGPPPIPALSTASASVSGFGSVSDFGIEVAAGNSGLPVASTSASAMLDVDLLVNITGSTGNALFVPCFGGSGDTIGGGGASVSGGIVGASGGVGSQSDHEPIVNCSEGPLGFAESPSVVFTFGQPFTVDLTLSGRAGSPPGPNEGVEGQITVDSYAVVDEVNLNPIPGAVISVAIAPEPNTALLTMLTLGLTIFTACLRARRKRRCLAVDEPQMQASGY